MDGILELLTALNSMSPLGVTALLGVIIYILVKRQPSKAELSDVKTNHLHELPAMAETLRRMESLMIENFTEIRIQLSKK